MIYTPGEYQILYFNEVGAKRDIQMTTSYKEAKTKTEIFEKKHPTCSTSILLVMYNSRIISDKWGVDLLKPNEDNT